MIAARMCPGRFFHLLSNFNDIPTFRRLAANAEPVPLLASNWVNPELFNVDELPAKEFDMVMLANFAAYKRHFLLFRAMRDMSSDARVLVLGKEMDGRTAETIMGEAKAYGVDDRVVIKAGLPDAEMVRALRSAKVSLMLSGNEGSCVAVVESMFADIPVGVFADAVIGSKAYVNEQTGRLLHKRNLAGQLADFINGHDQYTPRKWVTEQNLSCHGSTRILNDHIRAKVTEWGEEWTTDIAVHHWRPNPSFVSSPDLVTTKRAYAQFEPNYGCSIAGRSTDGEALPKGRQQEPGVG